jgi:hypothetical protein
LFPPAGAQLFEITGEAVTGFNFFKTEKPEYSECFCVVFKQHDSSELHVLLSYTFTKFEPSMYAKLLRQKKTLVLLSSARRAQDFFIKKIEERGQYQVKLKNLL